MCRKINEQVELEEVNEEIDEMVKIPYCDLEQNEERMKERIRIFQGDLNSAQKLMAKFREESNLICKQ